MTIFGERVKQLRRIKKITQQELAQKVGVDRASISRIENDLVEPCLSLAMNIARVLNVSLSLLIETEQQPRFIQTPTDEQSVIQSTDGKRKKRVLMPSLIVDMLWERINLAPATSTGMVSAYRAGAVGYLVLLSGELTIHINGKTFHLREGDSFFFDAQYPQEFISGTASAEYIIAIKP